MLISNNQKNILEIPINTFYLRNVFIRNFFSCIIILISALVFFKIAIIIGLNIFILFFILGLFIIYICIDISYILNVIYINKFGSPLIIRNSQINFHNISLLAHYISKHPIILDINEIQLFSKGDYFLRHLKEKGKCYIEILTTNGKTYTISGLLYDFDVNIAIKFLSEKGSLQYCQRRLKNT